MSWISLKDVAEFAAMCVENPAAHNATLELGGPDALSPLDVVRLAEDIGGAPITVERVPVDALQRQRAEAATPTDESFADLMLHLAAGHVVVDMDRTVNRIPVELTPVRDYVRRVLAG